MNQTTGAKKDKRDRKDFRAGGIIQTPKEYPLEFSLDDKFPSKNQWQRGSCSAQGQAHHKERQEDKEMSARFVMAIVKTFIEKNTGWGGYTRSTFKAVNKYGIPCEKLYPEPNQDMGWLEYIDADNISEEVYFDALKHRSGSYWRVNKTINDVKDVLLTGNSVNFSMEWHKEMNKPIDGYFQYITSAEFTGHLMDIIGWKEDAFIVKNSWDKWGDNGNLYLRYSEFEKYVWDCWTSLDLEKNLPVDEYYGMLRKPTDIKREIIIKAKFLLKFKRLPSRRELNALLAYWSYDEVVNGTKGDAWLHQTKYDYYNK